MYNSLGTLDERAIGSLGFCTQLSRRLSVRRGEEEEERETRQALKRTMPRLVWVLRDFALELVDESGETVSSDAYLERSLRPNGRRESDDTRAAIAAYFPNRSCWCLPRPFATEEAATSGVARPRDEFWQEFESFRDSVLYGDNCVVKSIEGTVVRGSTLAALAVEYAKAFQQTRPKITSAWRAAVDIQLSTAIQRGVASHAASLRERDGDLATRHARGCRLAEDAVREAVLGGGSVSLCAAVETAIAELRRECDAALGEYRDGSRKRRETVLKAQLATLEGEVLAPALEQTRAIFALADDPRLEGAYDSLDDAELRLTRLISRVVSPRERVDVDDDEAFSLAQHAVRFTVAASFEAARAVSDTAHDRREAALALCEQQKRDLESRIGFLEGQDKALRESVDEQRKKQHFELTEALAQKTRVQTLEAAVRAERSRAADLVAQVESSRAELADAAAALDNEERWQRELQERLDMRIKMSQEREEDLARRLERAQRRRKYTVLDFLLDDPDDVAEKFNIDSDKLEKFLADINLPNILPALKHLGASRVSDLMYLEPDDLDELVDIDIVQKRRLMKAVDAAKAEYSASANAGRCSLS